MQELIDPNRTNQLITRFEGINHKMGNKEHGYSEHRGVCKKHKYGGIGGAVVKIHLPAFPFLDTHPGALKGKIAYKMTGQPDQQHRDRDIDEHGHAFSSLKFSFMSSISREKWRDNELYHGRIVK